MLKNTCVRYRATFTAVALLTAVSLPGQVSVGVGGGPALGVYNQNAVESFTSSKSALVAPVFGAEVGYRFRNGVAVGVAGQQIEMPFKNEDVDLGTLWTRATVAYFGYQGVPARGRGMSFHALAGGGFARTDFRKDVWFNSVEQTFRAPVVITTNNPPVFWFSFGGDYFASKYFSVTVFDYRMIVGNADTSWSFAGRPTLTQYSAVDKIRLTNAQFVFGVRFWIQ